MMQTQAGRRVLVSGATGLMGGCVARGLLDAGHRVRALVRNPAADKARALQALGVELWQGNLEDQASVQGACAGQDAFFLHTVPWWVGAPQEPALALGAARAAQVAGMPQLIFCSAAGADANSGFVVLESKGEIERGLRDVRIPTVSVVAPAFLMENFLAPLWFGGIANGEFPIPVPADTALQMVSAQDLSALVGRMVEDPRRFAGQRLPLASDAPTCQQAATIAWPHQRLGAQPGDHARGVIPALAAPAPVQGIPGVRVQHEVLHTTGAQGRWDHGVVELGVCRVFPAAGASRAHKGERVRGEHAQGVHAGDVGDVDVAAVIAHRALLRIAVKPHTRIARRGQANEGIPVAGPFGQGAMHVNILRADGAALRPRSTGRPAR